MKIRRMAALLGAVALTFSATSVAFATAPVGHEVTICHANSDEKAPYVIETPDISQAGYSDNEAGHAGHGNDGVWYPGAKGDGFDWGDIIPPYDYQPDEGPLFHYDGLNWTAAGQAIWNSECQIDPKIHVVKSASVDSVPFGGGEVTYTYAVTNTGNVPLSNVTVSDDKCSPVAYVSGDTNTNSKLDLTETWTFSCTTTITVATTNTALATGHAGDTEVTDTDQATVTVAAPVAGITIDKTADPTNIVAGADVTYTYIVTNTGDIDLDPVTVSDDNGTPGDTSDDFNPDCPKTKLAVDESMTCTALVHGTQVTTTNVAVATGWYGEEQSVTDNDDATVTVGDGGVQAETDTPTGPPTDSISSTTTDAGGALPLLLLVLGVIGVGAVVLTPKRNRR